MSSQRDNYKAGLFVLAGVILSLIVIFTLADFNRLFERKQEVRVFYKLSDGLKGLGEGAQVTLGGTAVGEVTEIADEIDAGSQRVVGKTVTISLPKRVRIFQNSVVELVVPPIGSGTKLNIRNVGTGAVYDPTQAIDGAIARSELTRQFAADVGIEDAQRGQIKSIIANLESLTAALAKDVPRITEKVDLSLARIEPLMDELRSVVANVKSIAADLDAKHNDWFERLDHITASLDDATRSVRDLIKDKSPDIRKTVDNVAEITDRIRSRTLTQVDDALAKAIDSLESVSKASSELKVFAAGQRPVLERAVANAHLTTAQLKLAAIEVRRSPWRLLYTPTDKELESDNLYDAARSFAMAAGALDAAAQSLRYVAKQQPQEHDQINRMIDHLEALFARFEEAEDGFWRALKRQPAQAATSPDDDSVSSTRKATTGGGN